jgi:hypothetical protein
MYLSARKASELSSPGLLRLRQYLPPNCGERASGMSYARPLPIGRMTLAWSLASERSGALLYGPRPRAKCTGPEDRQ